MQHVLFNPSQGEQNMPTVKFVKTSEFANAPTRATEGSAGWDLYALDDKHRIIQSMRSLVIDTGIAIELPQEEGKVWEAQVRSRSGLAAHSNIMVLNSPGTIDSDYRGNIKVILMNLGTDDVQIRKGSAIAQLVVTCHDEVDFEEVDALTETERGEGGLGSTDAQNDQPEEE